MFIQLPWNLRTYSKWLLYYKNGICTSALVEESGKVLYEPLRRKYFFIGIYATIVWFISMNYLASLLWGTVHSC